LCWQMLHQDEHALFDIDHHHRNEHSDDAIRRDCACKSSRRRAVTVDHNLNGIKGAIVYQALKEGRSLFRRVL
jgi:hypothetical protein